MNDFSSIPKAGSPQTKVLGMNFHCITELAAIEDDERLALWLRATLERMFWAFDGTQL